MDLSLDQAKAFCTVVEQGGYTKAANRLNKSHSSLIYLIKSLEQNCGFALFNRKEYRNVLTPLGRRIYLKCLELLNKVDELDILCGQFKYGWEPNLKIVFDGILPFDPFFSLFKKFRKDKIPTIIQTYSEFLEGVESSFDSLNADIMISILPPGNKNLRPFYLKQKRMYLVAHKDHPINQKSKKWNFNELEDFDFLTIRGSGPTLGLNTGEFEKSASIFLSDFSVKKEAILKKTGFGWLPEHLIEKELDSKLLVPIKWERESHHIIQPILFMKSHKVSGPASQIVIESLKHM